jgi:hypothetical protein
LNVTAHDIAPVLQASATPPPAFGRLSVHYLIAPLFLATLVQALALTDVPLWVQPDSAAYLNLAGAILRGDWSNEQFLMRPPGYPLLLALLMKTAGEHFDHALLLVQRLMVIAIVLLTAETTRLVTARKNASAMSGIFAALTWPLTAYAATVLTEIPYTFLAMVMLVFLARHLRDGRRLC